MAAPRETISSASAKTNPSPPKEKPTSRMTAGSKAAALLEEGIMKPRARRYSTDSIGIMHFTGKNTTTDFGVSNSLARVLRKMSEDYPGRGEYVASVGDEFQGLKRCSVYMALQQKTRDSAPKNLERRIEVWRDGDEWCIDESAGHTILPGDEIFQVFAEGTPTIKTAIKTMVNEGKPDEREIEKPLTVVFKNMDIDDDECEIKDSGAQSQESSVAMMPFYYRDSKRPSGIIVFEGDLRCKGSKLTGFNTVYWTARLAMGIAAALSFQLTHRFDAVTNLGKLQDFRVDIRTGIKKTVSSGENLCLMLIDLDHFKSINTSFGYPGGDAVLKEVADVIKSSIRSNDSATRMAGDEFTVVLRDVSWSEAQRIADRILENIRDLKVKAPGSGDNGNGKSISVTGSMGMVNVTKVAEELGFTGNGPPTDDQVEEIYDCAFKRSNGLLLEAKHGGRGRVLSA